MTKFKQKRGNLYFCNYCHYTTINKKDMKKHEEKLHGCYRDKNPRSPKVKRQPKELIRSITKHNYMPVVNSDIKINVRFDYYNNDTFNMYTDDTIYGDEVEIVFDNDLQTFAIKDIDKLRKEK